MPKRTFRSLARSVFYSAPVVGAVRAWKRKGCRILAYHRFPPGPSNLRAQCEHIRRYYCPVSMNQIAETLAGGPPLPENAVAVTVDDGHRDFLHAQPILSKYEIPATLFIVTGIVDGHAWLWFDQVSYLVDRTELKFIELRGTTIPLFPDRKRGASRIQDVLKGMQNGERLERVAALPQMLGVALPVTAPLEHEVFSWEDVRRLSAQGIDFGCHSKTHPILSRLDNRSDLEEEILGAKTRMERELGRSIRHFAYPNGTWSDFNEEVVRILDGSGFTSAVTAEPEFNYGVCDKFRLRRLGVEPDFPERRFVELLAGLRKY